MAKKSDSLQSFSFTLKELSEDEKIRLRCEARERYYADQKAAVNTGFQDGYKTGYNNGYDSGRKETSDSLRALYGILSKHRRYDDIERCEKDNAFLESLLKELHLTDS